MNFLSALTCVFIHLISFNITLWIDFSIYIIYSKVALWHQFQYFREVHYGCKLLNFLWLTRLGEMKNTNHIWRSGRRRQTHYICLQMEGGEVAAWPWFRNPDLIPRAFKRSDSLRGEDSDLQTNTIFYSAQQSIIHWGKKGN